MKTVNEVNREVLENFAKEQSNSVSRIAADLKRLQEAPLQDIVDNKTLDKYHHVPLTKQQIIDLHDSLCYTRPDKYGAFPQEVESLITHLDYLIDNLP